MSTTRPGRYRPPLYVQVMPGPQGSLPASFKAFAKILLKTMKLPRVPAGNEDSTVVVTRLLFGGVPSCPALPAALGVPDGWSGPDRYVCIVHFSTNMSGGTIVAG
ncbi:hypothetical protein ACT3TE_13680, partial [Brachybacterium sp. AOP42-B2-9]